MPVNSHQNHHQQNHQEQQNHQQEQQNHQQEQQQEHQQRVLVADSPRQPQKVKKGNWFSRRQNR